MKKYALLSLSMVLVAALITACTPNYGEPSQATRIRDQLTRAGVHFNIRYVNIGSNATLLKVYLIDTVDLNAVKGIPFDALYLTNTNVTDLTPIKDTPLVCLLAKNTAVTDLSPLTNMPLRFLDVRETPVEDLSPLANMTLEHIGFDLDKITNGLDVIRNMESVTLVNRHPPERFWKQVDFRRAVYSGEKDRLRKEAEAEAQAIAPPPAAETNAPLPEPHLDLPDAEPSFLP